MHFSPAFILAALPFLAAATQPLKARQGTDPTYTLLAIHSGDQVVHNQPIVASNEAFYIGKASTAICSNEGGVCLDGNGETQVSLGNGTAALTVSVPGGQEIYVASTGALSYTPPHSHAAPPGAKFSGFETYTSDGSSDGVHNLGFAGANSHDWLACTSANNDVISYKIFANVTGGQGSGTSIATHCHDIAIALVAADASKSAFQFS